MKRYNLLYLFLFILMVTGGFASMAQNAYGQKLLGGVAFAFGVIFLIRFSSIIFIKHQHKLFHLTEWLALTILATVMGMRVFYIWFPGVEIVFGISGLVLASLYIRKAFFMFFDLIEDSHLMALNILAYHASVAMYMLSLALTPFFPILGEPLGGLGFFFALSFFVISLFNGSLKFHEDRVSPFSYVGNFKDGSLVLLSLFLIFTIYTGLSRMDMIPTLYASKYPDRYYELVREAEYGEEEPANGIFQHEKFKKEYEAFVERTREVSPGD